MRKALFLLISLLFITVSISADNTVYVPFQGSSEGTQYVPDQFVVKFRSIIGPRLPIAAKGEVLTGIPSIDALTRRFGVTAMEEEFPGATIEPGLPDLTGYRIVTFGGNNTLDEVISAYAACPYVESVEPIGIHPLYDVWSEPLLLDRLG